MAKPDRSKVLRKLPRSPSTGKFEEGSPLNDPKILQFAITTKTAIEHLEPLFESLQKDHLNDAHAGLISLVCWFLSSFKENISEQLEVGRKPHWSDVSAEIRAAARYGMLGADGSEIVFSLPSAPSKTEVGHESL